MMDDVVGCTREDKGKCWRTVDIRGSIAAI